MGEVVRGSSLELCMGGSRQLNAIGVGLQKVQSGNREMIKEGGIAWEQKTKRRA